MSPAGRQRAPLLRLDGISLSFKAIMAVCDIGFEVRPHEVCALIGPNGAGKSSLLNIVSGVYRPQAGRITFDGETHAYMTPRAAAKRGISRTFQNIAIFKGMSVLENVIAGAIFRSAAPGSSKRCASVERRSRRAMRASGPNACSSSCAFSATAMSPWGSCPTGFRSA